MLVTHKEDDGLMKVIRLELFSEPFTPCPLAILVSDVAVGGFEIVQCRVFHVLSVLAHPTNQRLLLVAGHRRLLTPEAPELDVG